MSKKTTKGLFFKSVEGVLMQVTSFVLQMVLARILVPEDFGVVALLGTFINLANTFVNNGLSSALLQRKNIRQEDICTVFYIDLSISLVMYLMIFIAAPWIAAFYENPALTLYLRVFSISIIIGTFASIQLTVGRYRLNFFPSLVSNVAATAVQAAVGIGMALGGCGVWSLLISQLSASAVRSLLLVALTRWMPTLQFSFTSFKQMFSYSWKLFAGWMIGTLYQDAFSWVIGKAYDSHTLGCYSKGNSIPSIINKVVTQVTTAVMFPAIAKNQDDKALVKEQTRQMISVSAALVFPVMAGVAGVADSLVRVLLTDKWADCVPVIQIMCIPLALNVISNANMQTFNALGRSDLFLKMETIKRGVTIALVLVAVNINYYFMLACIALGGVASLVMNAIFDRKLLEYRLKEYVWDTVPYAVCAIALFAVVMCLNLVQTNIYLRFALQLASCVVVYLGLIFSGLLPAFKTIRTVLVGFLKIKK